MIVDTINNLRRYNLPYLGELLGFIDNMDPAKMSVPELGILGRDLFVRPMQYRTKDPGNGPFEVHRTYIDLQYVLEGAEIMETAPVDMIHPLTEYDVLRDYSFFTANKDISRILVRTGEFAVFFPGEAHRTCCSPVDGERDVRKLVFKLLNPA